MIPIIKRGGFREKTARQSKYKDSVNHQADIPEQPRYQDVKTDVAEQSVNSDLQSNDGTDSTQSS